MQLGRSTVARLLGRLGLARLQQLTPRARAQRYEYARPGELLHVDAKSSPASAHRSLNGSSISATVKGTGATANNPAPTLSALSPTSATAGGPAFTLMVTGTNFVSGYTVRWNGNARTTTLVSAT